MYANIRVQKTKEDSTMKYSFNLTICGECTQDTTTIYLHWVSTRKELWNELCTENVEVAN